MVVMTVAGLALPIFASAKPRPAARCEDRSDHRHARRRDRLRGGVFDVERFANQGGTLTAIGTFAGTITDDAGTFSRAPGGTVPLALPVDLQQSEGQLPDPGPRAGPLNLDLLGLEVFLDTVHLNITAQSGPGNLLGNLLCAVAGLLDGPTGVNAILNQLATLLNQLLGILG